MSKPGCAAALVLSLLVCGCGASKLHPYELDEAAIGEPAVNRVGLLPLNALVAIPPELDGATDRVTSVIRAHLEACGVEIVPFSLAEATTFWGEVSAAGAPADAPQDKVQAYVRRLYETRAFDVLLQPSLVYRDARIRSVTHIVTWDGVKRELEVKGHTHMSGSLYMTGDVAGKMTAVSLHLAAYRLDGARVFDSFGGLDLVHEVEFGTTYRQDLNNRIPVATMEFNLKRKRLRNEANLREGVAMAFTPWLDPPEASLAEAPSP